MTDPGDLIDRLAALEADNHRLRRLLDEAGVTDSLRHALRDTMALLRTIIRRSADTASDVESYVAHLEGRIDSLMRMRAQTDAFGEADLHLLVSEELLSTSCARASVPPSPAHRSGCARRRRRCSLWRCTNSSATRSSTAPSTGHRAG